MFGNWFERLQGKTGIINIKYDLSNLYKCFPRDPSSASKHLFILLENIILTKQSGVSDADISVVLNSHKPQLSQSLLALIHTCHLLAIGAANKDVSIVNTCEARLNKIFEEATGSPIDLTRTTLLQKAIMPRRPATSASSAKQPARRDDHKRDDTIFMNADMEVIPVILKGESRTVHTSTVMLTMLLLAAKQNGWQGGSALFDSRGGVHTLGDIKSGIIIREFEASTLGQSLASAMLAEPTEPEQRQFFTQFFSLCREGEFEIVVERRASQTEPPKLPTETETATSIACPHCSGSIPTAIIKLGKNYCPSCGQLYEAEE